MTDRRSGDRWWTGSAHAGGRLALVVAAGNWRRFWFLPVIPRLRGIDPSFIAGGLGTWAYGAYFEPDPDRTLRSTPLARGRPKPPEPDPVDTLDDTGGAD